MDPLFALWNVQIEIQRPAREQVVPNDHLAKVCSPDSTPDKEESISFYDLVSKREGLEIMRDPDFPEAIKLNSCRECRWGDSATDCSCFSCADG